MMLYKVLEKTAVSLTNFCYESLVMVKLSPISPTCRMNMLLSPSFTASYTAFFFYYRFGCYFWDIYS